MSAGKIFLFGVWVGAVILVAQEATKGPDVNASAYPISEKDRMIKYRPAQKADYGWVYNYEDSVTGCHYVVLVTGGGAGSGITPAAVQPPTCTYKQVNSNE